MDKEEIKKRMSEKMHAIMAENLLERYETEKRRHYEDNDEKILKEAAEQYELEKKESRCKSFCR